jgi:L-lysine 2,3-aminomutase
MTDFDLDWMVEELVKRMESRGLSIDDMMLVAKGVKDRIEYMVKLREELK